MSYQSVISVLHFNHDKMKQLEAIKEPYNYQMSQHLFATMLPNQFLVIEGGGIPEDCTFWLTAVRVADMLYIYNSEVIVRVKKNLVQMNEPTETDWKELFLAIGPENLEINHYEYLELVIEVFWKRVFGRTLSDMWCCGIITSHGDKGYGYKSTWEEANIPFTHGMLLFLLTYTKELGETPKHESCEWVVANYQKYLPMILESEKEAGL